VASAPWGKHTLTDPKKRRATVAIYLLWQLQGTVEKERAVRLGLRLLGLSAEFAALGSRSVSHTLRH
jgi:hypothetical protein